MKIIDNSSSINRIILCKAIIKKKGKGNTNIQCRYRSKNGYEYCGIHLKLYKNENKNKNVLHIIKIQSMVRKWLIYRRRRVNNREDIASCQNIFLIPSQYYFEYQDNNIVYAFDIRTFTQLLSNSNINPYNLQPFDNSVYNKYNMRVEYLQSKNYLIEYEEEILSEENEYKQLLLEVFQLFDKLGHYTNTEWFEKMTIYELIDLYISTKDMIYYRAQLSYDMIAILFPSGVFTRSYDYNMCMNSPSGSVSSKKRRLQIEILGDYIKILTYARDMNDRKLCANLLLSAFVEISPNAAISLSYLVQNNYTNNL